MRPIRKIDSLLLVGILAILLSMACQTTPSTPTPTATVVPSPTLIPTATLIPSPTPNLQDQLLQQLLAARATATALTPTPTPLSSPTPRVVAPDDVFVNPSCGPTIPFPGYQGDLHEHFVHWTEDGSHLVFSLDDEIWTFDIERSQVRLVADVDKDYWGPHSIGRRRSAGARGNRFSGDGYRFNYGFYADVSPDGSRIVYSTCESVYHSSYQMNVDLYEIATVNIDGSGYLRLTENEYFENYPVWSPDGTEIAFSRYTSSNQYYPDQYYPEIEAAQRNVSLSIKSAEDGEERILYSTESVALYPPAWSPDGQRLAFIANEGECCPYLLVLHTVRPDDSELTRIGETTAPGTWSPDGEELAFAAVEGEEAVVYAVRADGTGLRTIWRSGPDDPSTPVSQVSWSPDGSEILFTSDHLYVTGSDGSGLRPLGPRAGIILRPSARIIRAAWSPDGSRVAIYYVDYLLVTVARDGTDLRELVEIGDNGLPTSYEQEPTPQ